MHSFHYGTTTIHHNSDMSGDVIICLDGETLTVDADAILAFVANYVRSRRIAAIELAGTDEILTLPL